MGRLTVKWERRIYEDKSHEFVCELATFLPPVLEEYDCAAMLGTWAKVVDGWQSKQQFEQFCKNVAAVKWLATAMERVTEQALEKWNSGDFTKEASNNGEG